MCEILKDKPSSNIHIHFYIFCFSLVSTSCKSAPQVLGTYYTTRYVARSWLRARYKASFDSSLPLFLLSHLFPRRSLGSHIFSLPYPRFRALSTLYSAARDPFHPLLLPPPPPPSRTTSLITTYFNTIRRHVTPTIEGITINAWSRGCRLKIIFLKRTSNAHDQL